MPGTSDLIGTAVSGAINPLSLIPAVAQTGLGLFQSLFSGKRKAQRDMEQQAANSPIYSGSRPIADYYNQAKARYGVSPYQSAQYLQSKKQANRATAAGLNTLQGRGAALAGVGKLTALNNDAMERAGVNATNEQSRRFGQLGSAANMQSADDLKKFQINQLDPYNRRLQLAMMKAGAAGAEKGAGISNLFGGLSNSSLLLSGLKKKGTPTENFDYLQSIGD